MDTAQELLQQPIILVVLAGLVILTAVILFVVPSLGFLMDKLKVWGPKEAKSEKKPAAKPISKAKSFTLPSISSRRAAYALIIAVIIVGLGVGGWYTYTTLFQKTKEQPEQMVKPNYNLEYTITGTVREVDHETGKLVVFDEYTGQSYTLKINPLTKVFLVNKELATTALEKDQDISVRSNADFSNEDVNIFEVSIIEPVGLPDGRGGTEDGGFRIP